MIRTYALEPDVASDGMAFATFVQGLGIENGRLMAAFPRSWFKTANSQLHNVHSVRDRTRITELLKCLQTDGLVKARTGLPYEGHQSWLDNAIRHIDRFDAVICADHPDNRPEHPQLHPASALFDNPAFWKVDRRITFTANRGKLAQLLQPLFLLDSHVAIMDPFFNPKEQGYLDGLLDIVNALPQPTPLVIHTSGEVAAGNRPLSTEEWEDTCRATLTTHIERLGNLLIVRWASRDSTGRPHERWVITPRGGIELGRGIAVGRYENTATLLPGQTAAQLWEEFGQSPFSAARYELRDTVEVC